MNCHRLAYSVTFIPWRVTASIYRSLLPKFRSSQKLQAIPPPPLQVELNKYHSLGSEKVGGHLPLLCLVTDLIKTQELGIR